MNIHGALVFFHYRFYIGQTRPRKDRGVILKAVLYVKENKVSLDMPGNIDIFPGALFHFGAGGEGVIEGVREQDAQIDIADGTGIGQQEGALNLDSLAFCYAELIPNQYIQDRIICMARKRHIPGQMVHFADIFERLL